MILVIPWLHACRSHKSVAVDASRTEAAVYTSCYPIESITVAKCRLNITDGGKSYQLNGSIHIRPDSVCYFRGVLMVEVFRGVVFRDSFAIINRLERICYKGHNDYLGRMAGYPVNPEVLFRLFTADRCEDMYREQFGFSIRSGNDHHTMIMQGERHSIEMNINPDNRTIESITAYDPLQKRAGFRIKYSQYQQYRQFLLPGAFDISATGGAASIGVNAVFQDMAFNQPQQVNFSIPRGYTVVELR
jgi:hypothetical protein